MKRTHIFRVTGNTIRYINTYTKIYFYVNVKIALYIGGKTMSINKENIDRRVFLRKSAVLSAGVAGSIILTPEEAEAGVFGIAFRAMAWSFGTVVGGGLAAGILVTGTTALAAYGAYSVFRDITGSTGRGGSRVTYYATQSPTTMKKRVVPRKPVMVSVSFNPKKRVNGATLRILAIQHDLLKNDGIMIANKGRLIIKENGELTFVDTKFKGYAYLQQSGELSVWTKQDHHVLTRTTHANIFHNFSHDSNAGREAVTSLLGDVRDA